LNVLGFRPGSGLPPEIWVGGASPSQEQKCPWVGKRERSSPISLPVFPHQIADHVVQLHIHLRQRFLHVGDAPRLDLASALTNERAHGAHGIAGTKGPGEQTVAHQLPNPLTIEQLTSPG
jgi:hypothetical protein